MGDGLVVADRFETVQSNAADRNQIDIEASCVSSRDKRLDQARSDIGVFNKGTFLFAKTLDQFVVGVIDTQRFGPGYRNDE